MSDTPLYNVDDVVYLRESAALGFLEPVRIAGISKTTSTTWVYTIKMGAGQPTAVSHYGDRIHMVRGSVVYFTEDEFVLLCDAFEMAEVNAQKQLDNIKAQRAILCASEPTANP